MDNTNHSINNSTTQSKSSTLKHNIQNPPLIYLPIHNYLLCSKSISCNSAQPTHKESQQTILSTKKPSTNSYKSTNSALSINSHFKTLMSNKSSKLLTSHSQASKSKVLEANIQKSSKYQNQQPQQLYYTQNY